MIKQTLINFVIIIICCWSLPCKGWWHHNDFLPADPESVVAETFFSGGVGPHKGYSGLGEKNGKITYITYLSNLKKFTNTYKYHTKILREKLSEDDYEMYLIVNASGIGNHTNMFANRAVLDYAFCLVSNHSKAPKHSYITVVISYRIDLSIDACPPCPISYKCYYGTKGAIFAYNPEKHDPTDHHKWPPGLSKILEITEEDYPLNKKSYKARLTSGMLLGQVQNIRIYACCNILCDYEDSLGSDGCIASVDPIITIDPDQIVEIDGVEYPANEIYQIKYGKAVIDLPMSKPQPYIPLLLLDD